MAVGAFAGCLEMVLAAPFDRIKTTMQTKLSLGTIQCAREIFHTEGMAGFYRGIGWNLMQAATKGSVRWGINAFNDRVVTTHFSEDYRKKHPLLITGCIATSSSFMDGIITNITDRSKVFVMTSEKKSIFEQIRKNGFCFFLEGWQRSVMKQASIWCSYQLTYSAIKQKLSEEEGPLTVGEKLLLATGAAVVSAAVSTLPDLLKTQIQMENPLQASVAATISHIWKNHGISGFFTTMGIKMVRSTHYSVFTYFIMDACNALPGNMKKN